MAITESTNATITVSIGEAFGEEVTLNVAYIDDTATGHNNPASGDYDNDAVTQVVFSSTDTSKDIVVPITNDGLDEETETFTVTITPTEDLPDGYTLGNASTTITINDDDNSPELTDLSDVSVEIDQEVDITASATDADSGDSITYSWARDASETTPALPDTTLNAARLRFTPTEVGTYTMTVTASDGNGNTDSEEVVITVTKVAVSVPETLSVAEGSNATVTVSTSQAFGESIVFNVTYGGTATGHNNLASGDYDNDVVTQVTFSSTDTSQDIVIPTSDDDIDDDSETITVTIAPSTALPSKFELGNATATVTITDDDHSPVLTVPSSKLVNPNQLVDITASATDADNDPITYEWTRKTGETKPPLPEGTTLNTARLRFTPTTAGTYTMTVTASDGNGNTDSQTVVITASSAPAITFTNQITVNPPTVSQAGTHSFSVTGSGWTGASSVAVAICPMPASGVAAEIKTDFDKFRCYSPGGFLTAAVSSGSFTVAITNISVPAAGIVVYILAGNFVNPSHRAGFAVRVVAPTPTPTPTPTATATPTPTPTPAVVAVPATVSVTEGSDAEVEISVGRAFGSSVTFSVSYADGTATGAANPSDGDYDNDAVDEVVFGSGDTSQTISVPTTGDDLDEDNETFTVSISATLPSGFELGNASTTVTITDDDESPELAALDDVSVKVGQDVDITASATDGDGDTVSFAWTRDSTETLPALPDNTALDAARLRFTPTEAGTYTMTVTASDGNGNTDTERVVITVAAKATVAVPMAVAVTEGSDATVTISVGDAFASPVTFTVSYTDGTASGVAVPADGDFDNDAVTEVVFPASVTSKSFTVPITDDDLDEAAETFTVAIAAKTSLPPGWVMGNSSATVTITDDDESPELAGLSAVSAKVGQQVNITASATDADADTVSYSWARKVGETDPALPQDAVLSGAKFQFTPTEAGTYTMVVTASDGNGNSDTATVVITVAAKTAVAISTEVAVTEGSDSSASVTITTAEAFGRRTVFTVSYVDGTASGAAVPSDGDFDNDAVTEVVFGARHTSRTFMVPITDDDVDEEAESFTVRIAPKKPLPSGFTLGNSSATVTITDDDSSPVLAGLSAVSAKVGEPVSVTAKATDADGDTVSFSWARDASETAPALPGGTRLNRARLRFAPTEAGTYTMTVTASDGNGNSDSKTVVITVAAATVVAIPTAVAVTEGSDATVTITTAEAFGTGVVFAVSYADGTATGAAAPGDGDFDNNAVTEVSFGAGDTSKSFTVPITDDDLDEAAETFTVSIAVDEDSSLPSGFALGNKSATVTITDDDESPVLPSLSAVSAKVGQSVSVDATATDGDGDTVTYAWTRKNGETAPALPDGTDLDVATLSFTPASAGIYTMTVTASDGNGNSDTATVVITVTTATPVSIPSTVAVTEGSDATVTITTGAAFGEAVSFTVSYTNGTATGAANPSDGDFDNDAVTTVSFPAAGTTKSFTVPITDDDLDEAAETFTVTVTATLPSGFVLGNSSATVTITDDDESPVLAELDDVSVKAGQPVRVVASATDGDSNDGEDGGGDTITYSWTRKSTETSPALPDNTDLDASVLSFTPTEAGTYTMTVTASDGNGNSDTETVVITVSAASVVAVPTAVAVTEGSNATVTITTGEAFSAPVLFTVSYTDGTATGATNPSDGDFDNDAVTTVSFPAGDTSKSFTVPITDDDLDEASETFTVAIASAALPAGWVLGNSSATVTITDDDESPVLPSLSAVSVKAGQEVSIDATATDGDGDTITYTWVRKTTETAPALPGSTALNAARLQFTPTEAGTYTMTVTASDGNGNRDAATVVVTVAAKTVVAVPTAVAVTEGTDTAATITIGTTGDVAFGEAVTFNVSYADGTATGAGNPANADYDNDAVTTVSFAAGDTSKSFTVPVTDDDADETAETFTVTIAEAKALPAGFTLGNSSATVTITDDDESPVLAELSNVSVKVGQPVSITASATDGDGDTVSYSWARQTGETAPALPAGTALGAAGLSFTPTTTGTYTMTVTASDGNGNTDTETVVITVATATVVSIPTTTAVTEGSNATVTITTGEAFGKAVTFAVSYTDGTATGAGNPTNADYDNDAVTTVAFAAGDTSKTITVPITDDDLDEAAETFTVAVASTTLPTGWVLGNKSSTVTITDDDASPVLAELSNVSVKVGQPVSITASATDGDGDTVSYSWARKDGETAPALPGGTALNAAGLSFTPTTTGTYTMTVTASDGNGNTDTETVVITVTAATVVSIPTTTAVTEGSNATITITTGQAFGKAVTFGVSYADGTATGAGNPSNGDYDNDAITTVAFAAGDTSKSFTVPITDDDTDEAAETFTVTIASTTMPAGFTLSNASSTVTITDDDASPVLTALSNFTVKVGQPVDVTASATDGDGDTVSYQWARKPGETAPALPGGTTLGAARLQFTPTTVGTYSMIVTASDGNGNTGTAAVVITVAAKTVVSIPATVSVTEGTDASAVVTIGMDEPFGKAVTFNVAYADGTATGAADPTNGDYDNDAVTTVAFGIGDTSKSITIPITDDDDEEDVETFTVTISSATTLPAGFELGNASATVTIADDDKVVSGPAITVVPASVAAAGEHTFTVVGSGWDITPIVLPCSIPLSGDVLDVTPSLCVITNLVPASPDSQGRFTVTITIDVPQAGIIVAAGDAAQTEVAGFIVHVDSNDVVSVPTAVSVTEGTDASAQVTVTTEEAFGEQVTFDLVYTDITATGAGDPINGDYDNNAVTSVVFGAGDTSKTVTIPITDDDVVERAETFSVRILPAAALPSGFRLGNTTTTVTIASDDQATGEVGPVLVAVKVGQEVNIVASAGDDGDGGPVSYTWARQEDESWPPLPRDTVLNRARLRFTPTILGTYTMTITVTNPDGTTDTETVEITVVPPTPVSVPGLVVVTEGTDDVATVIISTDEPFHEEVAFSVSYTDGTAIGGGDPGGESDYGDYGITWVVFEPGDSSKAITVPIFDDDTDEETESFVVRVVPVGGLPDGFVLGNTTATVAIVDDDRSPVLEPLDDVVVKVGQVVDVTASATDGDGDPITYVWDRRDGEVTPPLPEATELDRSRLRFAPTATGTYTMTVTASDDHGNTDTATVVVAVVSTLRFGADDTSVDISVPIPDDDLYEDVETITVVIEPVSGLPGGFVLGNATATVTVLDDDHPPELEPIGDVRVRPGRPVDVTAVATDGDDEDTVTYTWARADGEAEPALPQGTVLNRARLRFTPVEVGVYTMTVTASDGNGNTDSWTMVITVAFDDTPATTGGTGAATGGAGGDGGIGDDTSGDGDDGDTDNDDTSNDGSDDGNDGDDDYEEEDAPPVLFPINDVTVEVGQRVDVTAFAFDPEGGAVTYGWTRADDEIEPALPEDTALDTARLAFTPTEAGVYTMTITATDAAGNSASRTVVITVVTDSVVAVTDAVTVTEGTDTTATVTITVPEPFGETVAFTIRYAYSYD